MQAEGAAEIDERFHAHEGTAVAKGHGKCAAQASVLEREQLADQQPRDGADAQREGECHHEYAKQRYPVVLSTRRCLVQLFEVGVRAEGGQCYGHEHSAGDEQRKPTDGVN